MNSKAKKDIYRFLAYHKYDQLATQWKKIHVMDTIIDDKDSINSDDVPIKKINKYFKIDIYGNFDLLSKISPKYLKLYDTDRSKYQFQQNIYDKNDVLFGYGNKWVDPFKIDITNKYQSNHTNNNNNIKNDTHNNIKTNQNKQFNLLPQQVILFGDEAQKTQNKAKARKELNKFCVNQQCDLLKILPLFYDQNTSIGMQQLSTGSKQENEIKTNPGKCLQYVRWLLDKKSEVPSTYLKIDRSDAYQFMDYMRPKLLPGNTNLLRLPPYILILFMQQYIIYGVNKQIPNWWNRLEIENCFV